MLIFMMINRPQNVSTFNSLLSGPLVSQLQHAQLLIKFLVILRTSVCIVENIISDHRSVFDELPKYNESSRLQASLRRSYNELELEKIKIAIKKKTRAETDTNVVFNYYFGIFNYHFNVHFSKRIFTIKLE